MWFKPADAPVGLREIGMLRLGGLNVYSDDQRLLEVEVNELAHVILGCSEKHLIAPREVVRHIAEQTGAKIGDRRFFNAVLGRCLRLGRLDTLTCGDRRKPYVCIIHPSNGDLAEQLFEAALKRLLAQLQVRVSEVREEIFPMKEWGTWYIVQNAFSRLAFLDLAVPGEKGVFLRSESLSRAVGQPSWQLPDFRKRWWLG